MSLVRALGLEPSLVRGKSPVPYQSGVTRVVGRGVTAGLRPAAPMPRPTPAGPVWQPVPLLASEACTSSSADARARRGMFRGSDASVVVKVLVSRPVAGRVEAGSEGVEAPAVGFGNRDTTVARVLVSFRA